MKFKDILILENDTERQGLPDILQDILDNEKVPHKTWWWFKQDVLQNTQESFKRFSEVSKDTMLLSYPSFLGWDNTFESHLHLFKELMKKGIKLKICIIYHPNFYLCVLNYMTELEGSKKQIETKLNELKEMLNFHEIYATNYYAISVYDSLLKDASTRLTYEWLKENYYVKGDKICNLETNKIHTVSFCIINEKKESINDSYVVLDKGDGTSSSDDNLTFDKFVRAHNHVR